MAAVAAVSSIIALLGNSDGSAVSMQSVRPGHSAVLLLVPKPSAASRLVPMLSLLAAVLLKTLQVATGCLRDTG